MYIQQSGPLDANGDSNRRKYCAGKASQDENSGQQVLDQEHMTKNNAALLAGISIVVWCVVFAVIAPAFSGVDVAIFRDAGANLALAHNFVARGLIYAQDLQPRLFAHYTPLTPLFYGIFSVLIPLSPRATTFFWFLLSSTLGLLAILLMVKGPAGLSKQRVAIIAILVMLPFIFFDNDRPEGLALILATLTLTAAGQMGIRGIILSGIAAALTALAHPFAGVTIVAWLAAVQLIYIEQRRSSVWRSVSNLLIQLGIIAVFLAVTVAIYRQYDRSSLQRFLGHATNDTSGLGQLRPSGNQPLLLGVEQRYASSLGHAMFSSGLHSLSLSLAILSSMVITTIWLIKRAKAGLTPPQKWVAIACLFSCVLALALFPAKSFKDKELAALGCTLAVSLAAIRLPIAVVDLTVRTENRASYKLALGQPEKLLGALLSPKSVVAMSGF